MKIGCVVVGVGFVFLSLFLIACVIVVLISASLLLLSLLALFSLLLCLCLSPRWRRQSYRHWHRCCQGIGCFILFAGGIGIGTVGILVLFLAILRAVVIVFFRLCIVWLRSTMQRVCVLLTEGT